MSLIDSFLLTNLPEYRMPSTSDRKSILKLFSTRCLDALPPVDTSLLPFLIIFPPSYRRPIVIPSQWVLEFVDCADSYERYVLVHNTASRNIPRVTRATNALEELHGLSGHAVLDTRL